MSDLNRYQTLKGLRHAEAQLAYSLDFFGDALAAREGYKSGLNGIDAIHFYLTHKFGWPPAQVRGMNAEDMRFVLQEEMHGFRLPKEAVLDW